MRPRGGLRHSPYSHRVLFDRYPKEETSRGRATTTTIPVGRGILPFREGFQEATENWIGRKPLPVLGERPERSAGPHFRAASQLSDPARVPVRNPHVPPPNEGVPAFTVLTSTGPDSAPQHTAVTQIPRPVLCHVLCAHVIMGCKEATK